VATERGPLVLPTIHGRIDRSLYLHGSVLAQWLNESNDQTVCITATIADAIVLARSAFAHSMNYRSVVVLGRADAVTDADEKLHALRAITEHVCAGRWHDVRPPSPHELQATLVPRVPIETASAKIRSGPPIEASSDLRLRVWAGQIPLRIVRDGAHRDPQQDSSIPLPPYLERTAIQA
jgi:nitroimidazol reductase NimA-like FMN-containing flavoprotein (pyridoxamine 5'-phosphate oxidase superfamily)